jgi:hypothetical protein
MSKKNLTRWTNPSQAQKMAYRYLGKTAKIYPSKNVNKKFRICDTKYPHHGKWINFGQMGYEDYTKHHDKSRRKSYLRRSGKIRGDWKRNKYSPNNLSRNILW